MGTRRIRRLIGVVVLGAVGLAGCAAAPTPATSGASRTSLASTTSGVESSTGIPSPSSTTADAQAALQAEAVEAVKQYYAAWNRAVSSRSSAELRARSLPQCAGCASDISDIDELKAKNQTARGGLITLDHLIGLPGEDSGILVQGDSTRAPVKILSGKGALVTSYPENTVVNRVWVLARTGGRLVIKDIS
ncbi:MAG: hypothetical protein U0R27_13715 [Candidatus Nanopelagicales bacterium]